MIDWKTIYPPKLMFWDDFSKDDSIPIFTPIEYIDNFGELEEEDYFLLEKCWNLLSNKYDSVSIIDKFTLDWVELLLEHFEWQEDYETCGDLKKKIDTWKTYY